MKNLTPNQAAAQAFQLFSQEAKLCETHPSKVPRTQGKPAGTASCNDLDSHSKLVEPCNEPVPSNSNSQGKIVSKQCDNGSVKGEFVYFFGLNFFYKKWLIYILFAYTKTSLGKFLPNLPN